MNKKEIAEALGADRVVELRKLKNRGPIEWLGMLPIRQELTVIPGDPTNDRKIRFKCIEHDGWTMYHKPTEPSLTPRQIFDDREWPRDENGKPIYHKPLLKDEIREGMKVVAKDNIFDYIYGLVTIKKGEDGKYYGESSGGGGCGECG